MGKLIYCTRTVPEMEKCLDELKRLRKYVLEQRPEKSPFLALCLQTGPNFPNLPKLARPFAARSASKPAQTSPTFSPT